MLAFLFPGQGSQTVGMGRELYAMGGAARVVFDRAAPHLPAGLLPLMFEGPQAQLDHTQNAQPALLCHEIALTACLRERNVIPEVCAGHSLGEIAALVVADALTFEGALLLVRERARLMSENVPEGGMAAVLGMAAEAIAEHLPVDVQIANFNGPGQTIISGATAALAEAGERLKAAGAKRVLSLPVSGPFHSRLMEEAAAGLAAYLSDVPMQAPKTPFISSVSAEYETDPNAIRRLLAEQLTRPVQWTLVMERLRDIQALEVGPGSVLAGLAKRMPAAPRVVAATDFPRQEK